VKIKLISQYISTFSFFFSIALIPATQSREFIGGIGVGEIFASIFITASAYNFRIIKSTQLYTGITLVVLGILIGTLNNKFFQHSEIFIESDFFGVIFSITFSIMAIHWLLFNVNSYALLTKSLVFALFLQLTPILVLPLGITMPAWMSDSDEQLVGQGIPFLTRYIGLSSNPNQIGILICAAPATLYFLAIHSESRINQILCYLGIAISVVLAILIRSNTVFIAYGIGIIILITLGTRWIVDHRKQIKRFSKIIMILPIGGIALISYIFFSIDKTGDAAANGRFPRWASALQGIQESYLLGAGPGAQSGEDGPFQGTEAHNFLLDLVLQGGLISLIGYAMILHYAIRCAKRTSTTLPSIILMMVLTQQISHYTGRQPMNWLYSLLPIAIYWISNKRSQNSIRGPSS
jgi:O-antigen ligase